MIKGDGWINGTGFGYKSISKKLLEDMAEVSIKLGYSVTFNKDAINIAKEQIFPTINNQPEIVNYNGRIYCVSVPNDTILIRRNGRVIWSKNSYAISYKMQQYVNSIEGGVKPNMVCMGHYHKADHLPSYRNIDCLQSGTFEWQTPFMARSGSQAHVGGWIVRVTVGNKKSMSNSVGAEFMAFYKR